MRALPGGEEQKHRFFYPTEGVLSTVKENYFAWALPDKDLR
jgi:hypothetical protein